MKKNLLKYLALSLGIGTGALLASDNAYAKVKINSDQNGAVRVEANQKDSYVTSVIDKKNSDAVINWLSQQAVLYNDAEQIKNSLGILRELVKNSPTVKIDWNLNKSYIKATPEGEEPVIINDLRFTENAQVAQATEQPAETSEEQSTEQPAQSTEQGPEQGLEMMVDAMKNAMEASEAAEEALSQPEESAPAESEASETLEQKIETAPAPVAESQPASAAEEQPSTTAEPEKPYNPVDKIVEKAEKERARQEEKEKKQELYLNKKAEKELKKQEKQARKKAKQESKKSLVSTERESELETKMNYILYGETGLKQKYHDSFKELLDESLKGKTISDIRLMLSPYSKVFETFDEKGNKAYIVDRLNEGEKSAVFYNLINENNVKSSELLLENDLNREVFKYARNKKLIGKSIDDVLENISNLKAGNAKQISDLKGDYKDGFVILQIPEINNILGVAYAIKDNKIIDIIDLDSKSFYRAAEIPLNSELNIGSSGNSLAVELNAPKDGRTAHTRFKTSIVYNQENKEMEKAQAVVSMANNLNESTVLGFSGFQGKEGNWSFSENDLFAAYLKDNLKIKFLTGKTNDKTKFDDSAVSTYILKQERTGESNPLVNLDASYKFPGQMPFVWGKPEINVRGAAVSGNDKYSYQWLSSTGNVLGEGSTNITGDYSTVAAGFTNTWNNAATIDKLKLSALVEAEINRLRQEKNGEMADITSNSETKIGLTANYNNRIITPDLLLMYQSGKDKDNNPINNVAGSLQLASNPLKNLVVIANYSGDSKGNNEAGIRIAYSPRDEKFFENETAYGNELALYNTKNNDSLLPAIHPNVMRVPPIYTGLEVSGSVGNDVNRGQTTKAAINYMNNRNKWGAGFEYVKKTNDAQYSFKLRKGFRR